MKKFIHFFKKKGDKNTPVHTSEDAVNHFCRLPKEVILEEIFTRLPPENLTAVSKVCKRFNEIAKNPNLVLKSTQEFKKYKKKGTINSVNKKILFEIFKLQTLSHWLLKSITFQNLDAKLNLGIITLFSSHLRNKKVREKIKNLSNNERCDLLYEVMAGYFLFNLEDESQFLRISSLKDYTALILMLLEVGVNLNHSYAGSFLKNDDLQLSSPLKFAEMFQNDCPQLYNLILSYSKFAERQTFLGINREIEQPRKNIS